jgi:hypothetical protein
MNKVFWFASVSALLAASMFVGCSDDKSSGAGSSGDDDGNGGSGAEGGSGPSGSGSGTGPASGTGMMTTTASTGPGSGGMGSGGGAPSGCNPVTNAGCNSAGGEACDLNQDGVFFCFPPPNDTALCGACDNSAGPFCVAGATCQGEMGIKCVRYCCTDADCGGSVCTKGGFAMAGYPDLGVCDTMEGCAAPAVAPSGGSCVP